MESIGERCFWHSGIEKITLPNTLMEIDTDAFSDCKSLKTVWVGRGCVLDVRNYVDDGVVVRRK